MTIYLNCMHETKQGDHPTSTSNWLFSNDVQTVEGTNYVRCVSEENLTQKKHHLFPRYRKMSSTKFDDI